jgi:hypothetical protein
MASVDLSDLARVEEIERKYESGLQTRSTGPRIARFVFIVSLAFALYHYITAGYTVPVDHWHMGIHLSGVLLLIYIGFPLLRRPRFLEPRPDTWHRYGNVPLYDWLLAVIGIATSLYICATWDGVDLGPHGIDIGMLYQSLRQGDPHVVDVIFGSALIVVLLEAVRRTLGVIVPIIIAVFTCYAVFGPHIPIDILLHPGVNWSLFVNFMYFPQEGIFGVTLWIVSTVVFHFVLFGILAQRMGLGQFFVDVATVMAGRYTGGLAKVSVVSCAFFGTISGSSIANTVSTGSLTIPNMKRMGYPGHFAGGVEAAASAGGQITPPIMGAAAFVMAEFLEVPYTTVVVAAAVPAAMQQWRGRFHAHERGIAGAVEVADPHDQHVRAEHARSPRIAETPRCAGLPCGRNVAAVLCVSIVGARRAPQHLERHEARLFRKQARPGLVTFVGEIAQRRQPTAIREHRVQRCSFFRRHLAAPERERETIVTLARELRDAGDLEEFVQTRLRELRRQRYCGNVA